MTIDKKTMKICILSISFIISIFLSGCSTSGELDVPEINVNVTNNDSNKIPVNANITNDVLDVSKQDQTTQLLELLVTRPLANMSLLNNLSLGQQTFNISTLIVPEIENVICLKYRDGNAFTQDIITNVTALGGDNYEVSVLSGVDFPYSTNDGCSLRSYNLAVDGSVNPVEFIVSPELLDENVEWDLTRLVCISQGVGAGPPDATPDATSLFTCAPENKGILFYFANNNRWKNLFYARDNSDYSLHMYDVSYTPANKNGLFAVDWRKTINGDDKSGAVARLSANLSDDQLHEARVRIDRDMTCASVIKCNWMGHETSKYGDSIK